MLSRETEVMRCLENLLHKERLQEWHFLVQKSGILQTYKTIPANKEGNEKSSVPTWLNKKWMKMQKLCEALGETLSSCKQLCPETMHTPERKFFRTGWPPESFSRPCLCIFPKNTLTKCFHLALGTTWVSILFSSRYWSFTTFL